MEERAYIAIDLKSFYASVECVERGLDPMSTNLVVADESRTEKTICLAVSPSLKTYGIPGRPRLFEVVQRVRELNAQRKSAAPGREFSGASYNDAELRSSKELSIDYIKARPRMALYIEYSTRIYDIYLRYIAPEDIHVYSIDEVFIDATKYLNTYALGARELAMKMILEVLSETGITATAGIGTNLYLCKVAMDIQAKHIQPDKNGVRIAELDEMSYRRLLWEHKPLTDFWRVGRGYAKRLEEVGLRTMGDIARCSVGKAGDYYNEELLYKLFGINAELLIDHAWGWEPCTMSEVKKYKPQDNSMSSGQVLQNPYPFEKAKLIAREMAQSLSFDLLDKGMVTDRITLMIGYDAENLKDNGIKKNYHGEVTRDYYGRNVPKGVHASKDLREYTSSSKLLTDAVTELFEQIVDRTLLIRRLGVTANRMLDEQKAQSSHGFVQTDMFTDHDAQRAEREREMRAQRAMLDIKKKYGKNAVLMGADLQEGATARERNRQIGGHKA